MGLHPELRSHWGGWGPWIILPRGVAARGFARDMQAALTPRKRLFKMKRACVGVLCLWELGWILTSGAFAIRLCRLHP